jgi:ribose/xylose/arabinose/galactoside ABC-type transport system permease subunit
LLWEQDVAGSNPVTPTILQSGVVTTLFAFGIGAVLGYTGVGTTTAALISFTAALCAKVLVDVTWQRLPFLGWPSSYAVYCHNLEQRGESTHYGWVSYLAQLIAFGLVLGGIAYAVARHFA